MAETVAVTAIANGFDELARKLDNVADQLAEVARANRKVARSSKQTSTQQKTQVTTGSKLLDQLLKTKAATMGVGWALKALKIPVYVAGFKTLTGGVFALAAAGGAVVASLGPVVGILGAIPAAAVGLLGVMGVVKLATSGIGEAVKVLSDQTSTLKERAEAMAGLSAPARAFATQLAGMKPILNTLKGSAAEAVLPGFGRALTNLTRLVPTVNRMLKVFGQMIGTAAEKAATMFAGKGFASDLEQIGATGSRFIGKLLDSFLALISMFRRIGVAAGPMTDKLGDLILKGAKFLEFAAAGGRASGKLERFFNRALTTTKQWGRILSNLTVGLFGLFRGGSQLGGDMADSLEKITRRFRDWTTSTRGMDRIKKFYDDARPALHELGLLIGAVAGSLGRVGEAGRPSFADTIKALRVDLLPAVEKMVVNIDDRLIPALVKLAEVAVKVLDFASFTPLIEAVVIITKIAGALVGLAGQSDANHQFATSIIAMGLAFKTLALVGNLTGVTTALKYMRKEGTLGFKAMKKLGNSMVVLRVRLAAMAAMQAVASAATAVWTAATAALSAAWAANPIGLIVIGVLLLIGAFVILYKKVDWFRNAVDAVFGFIKRNWPLLLAILTGPFGLMVLAVVKNFDKIKEFIAGIPQWISDRWSSLKDRFAAPFKAGIEVIRQAWKKFKEEVLEVGGQSFSERAKEAPARWGNRLLPGDPFGTTGRTGDTATRRGFGGGLARTIAAHGAIEGRVPGRRRITNALIGGGSGDHEAGRALDLVGPNLQAYRKQVQASGGYAELHGSGATRHLHAVHGDTATSRTRALGGGSDGGGALVLNGPLIGQVIAARDVDVERAAIQALNKWLQERKARRR